MGITHEDRHTLISSQGDTNQNEIQHLQWETLTKPGTDQGQFREQGGGQMGEALCYKLIFGEI